MEVKLLTFLSTAAAQLPRVCGSVPFGSTHSPDLMKAVC